jgi:hypothetical protein
VTASELIAARDVGAINSLAVQEESMGFGRGALLWLLGVPLPIIILLALFWHH